MSEHTGNGENGKGTMTAEGQPEAFARVSPEPPPAPPRKSLFKRPVFLTVLLIVVVVGTAVGVTWWLDARHYESTDDAFIQADATRVSSRVAGHVLSVNVNDNQFVDAGFEIARLDPRDLNAKEKESE